MHISIVGCKGLSGFIPDVSSMWLLKNGNTSTPHLYMTGPGYEWIHRSSV